MRSTFFQNFFRLVDEGHPLHLLTADLGFGVLTPYLDKYADHITNVGVAEANMIGLAAGMAMRNIRPFCYSMVPFLVFRTLDQIRTDLCASRLPVTLVGVGSGLSYGMEGMTHHAIEDIAVTRALPGMTILSPGDPLECEALLFQSLNLQTPCYLRLGSNNDLRVHTEEPPVVLGKLSCLHARGEVAIITTGSLLPSCAKAVHLLAEAGIPCRLYSAHTLKPFDEAGVIDIASSCKAIVSAEEHSVINGLGTAIVEVLLQYRYAGRFAKIGVPDEYCSQLGSRDWLRDHYGLDAASIAATVRNLFTN
ncbi:MAG: 1-deoxy-D-xylulose-5-phosphate synthase [Verrucomicrobia bacterium]|nr:1-deoxy-D-xylulose-5-phosphate synthase [Verrucomicrobiota bacterium]